MTAHAFAVAVYGLSALAVLSGGRPQEPVVAGAIGVQASRPAAGDTVPPRVAEQSEARKWGRWTRMTGDWNGLRGLLEKRAGVSVVAASEVQLAGSRSAGVEQLSTVALAVSGLGGRLQSWLELRAISDWGPGPAFSGEQGLSNVAAPRSAGPGEAWLELAGAGGSVRVRAGRAYATSEFAFIGTAAPFINPAFGTSPALAAMPAYPSPAAGVTGVFRLGRVAPVLSVGAYEGSAGRPVVLAQIRRSESPASWAWSAGLVAPTGGQDALPSADDGVSPPPAFRAAGVYAGLERPPTAGRPGLFLLAARGGSPCGVTAEHVAAGLVLDRHLPFGADVGGLAATAYRDRRERLPELVAEGFVRFGPAEWLYLQPDLQLWLPMPGFRPALRAARPAAILRAGVRY